MPKSGEAKEFSENYGRFLEKSRWSVDYPFPQFFVCCGFFMVYLLEVPSSHPFRVFNVRSQSQELSLRVFSSAGHGHSHHPPEGAG